MEHVQPGSGGLGGGHVTGGAISGLFHMSLGPILTASMTHYEMIEIANQQQYRREPHMPLTARIQYTAGSDSFSNLNDYKAKLTARHSGSQVAFDAQGRMLDNYHKPPRGGEVLYHVTYTLTETGVELTATASGEVASPAKLEFILPIVSRGSEPIAQPDKQTVHITKPKGTVTVHTDAPAGFATIPKERTFNIVPGLEAIPLTVIMEPGKQIRLRIEGSAQA
jgi:hypothetical protein